MYIADFLSRNYITRPVDDDVSMNYEIHTISIGVFNMSEKRENELKFETKRDKDLKQVVHFYYNGWPNKLNEVGELKHFFKIKKDITVENNLVYYNNRLIIPRSLRKFILNTLHETHLGSNKIKFIAKNNLYWPAMSSDIESFVNSCSICLKFSRSNNREPLLSHDIPNIPFYKVGSDITEYGGHNYLVVYDYYSRWLEVSEIYDKTSLSVIKKLKEIFSRNGIPKIFVSDNMPFNSYEMKNFAKSWNFEVITSSPNYPQSNGLAEKAVGITKNMLKKSKESNVDFELFLLNYRNSPVSNLKYSPAQLLSSRILRSKFPIDKNNLKPNLVENEEVSKAIRKNQKQQQTFYNRNSKKTTTSFNIGDKVWLQNFQNKRWEKAIIIKLLNTPRSYLIKTENKKYYRRNVKFLKRRNNFIKYDFELENENRNNERGSLNTEDNLRRSSRIKRTPKRLTYSALGEPNFKKRAC